MRLFSDSKRQRLVYVMLLVWISFACGGFYFNTSFAELATYYAGFAAPALAYIWGETRRPT